MLTPFQTQKITHYFNTVLDQDKNGILQDNDFLEIGESLCILWRYKAGSDEYNRVMDQCLANWRMLENHIKSEGGVANLEGFLRFFDKLLSPGNEQLYHDYMHKVVGDVFDDFDLDGDGVISINEYVDLFMCYHIKIKYSAKAFMKLDRNGDDDVSKEELLKALDEFFKSDDPNANGNWLFGFWGDAD
jgi:Ca2+-binding EF-hand superfamily protein